METIVHVHAKFIHKGSGIPYTGDEISIRMYDSDVFDDDFLGEAEPDEHGDVRIDIDPEHARSWDSIGEDHPDLYFVIMKNDEAVYHSRVLMDFGVEKHAEFDFPSGAKFDFGTYLVSV